MLANREKRLISQKYVSKSLEGSYFKYKIFVPSVYLQMSQCQNSYKQTIRNLFCFVAWSHN